MRTRLKRARKCVLQAASFTNGWPRWVCAHCWLRRWGWSDDCVLVLAVQVDAKLGASKSGYAVGPTLTIADLRAFCEFSAMISGWYDGFNPALLNRYRNIQLHRAKIASLPKIQSFYANATGARLAFQPFDPDAVDSLPVAPVTSLVSSVFLKTEEGIPPEMRTIQANPATKMVVHKSTCECRHHCSQGQL
eukprot:COSAG05_NODE_89_length_20177_cov_197.003586_14_plen_191_part_00